MLICPNRKVDILEGCNQLEWQPIKFPNSLLSQVRSIQGMDSTQFKTFCYEVPLLLLNLQTFSEMEQDSRLSPAERV